MKLKEQILALLKTLGYDPGDKKADLEKALDALEVPAQTPTPAPATGPVVSDPALKAQIDALNQKVTDLMGTLTKETEQRTAVQKTMAEQAKADQVKKVADTLALHEKAGRIIPAMKDHFKKLLETDYDTALKIIEGLPVDPAAKKAAEAGGDGSGKPKGQDKNGDGSKIRTLEQLAPISILEGIQKLSTSTN